MMVPIMAAKVPRRMVPRRPILKAKKATTIQVTVPARLYELEIIGILYWQFDCIYKRLVKKQAAQDAGVVLEVETSVSHPINVCGEYAELFPRTS